MKLLLDFLAAPDAELDTSCEDQVLRLHFAGAPWLAQAHARLRQSSVSTKRLSAESRRSQLRSSLSMNAFA
jgi:hypothetical protein